MQLRGNLVEVEIMLSLKTYFFGRVGWWGGWVAGENRIKAISSSTLKMSLAIRCHNAVDALHE